MALDRGRRSLESAPKRAASTPWITIFKSLKLDAFRLQLRASSAEFADRRRCTPEAVHVAAESPPGGGEEDAVGRFRDFFIPHLVRSGCGGLPGGRGCGSWGVLEADDPVWVCTPDAGPLAGGIVDDLADSEGVNESGGNRTAL